MTTSPQRADLFIHRKVGLPYICPLNRWGSRADTSFFEVYSSTLKRRMGKDMSDPDTLRRDCIARIMELSRILETGENDTPLDYLREVSFLAWELDEGAHQVHVYLETNTIDLFTSIEKRYVVGE